MPLTGRYHNVNVIIAQQYKDNASVTGKWLHYIFGLTFLPYNMVGDGFLALMEEAPSDSKIIIEFCDYLVENYIDENCVSYPPYLWAALDTEVVRTTNECEAFHSKFNKLFTSRRPNIYEFVTVLLHIQIDVYAQIYCVRSDKILTTKRDNFIDIEIDRFLKNF